MEQTGDRMQILAAGFTEAWRAEAAETELRAALDVGARDLSVEPVGGTREFVNGYTHVLGGHIREAKVPLVQDVVQRHGGEVLTELPAAWAGPASQGGEQ